MNRLQNTTSPYLRQHADNPVHWWPWSTEALAEAARTNKPILLSIGYAACHWCHVMAHESFEDAETADLMNRNFVNIKVDREERPDIDQLYMSALHGLGQHGGWPLTMFLTPDAKPFAGGTYFPPKPSHGRPSFQNVLMQVADLHNASDPRIEQNAQALINSLAPAQTPKTRDIPKPLSFAAADHLMKSADADNGGIGTAPKFPNTVILDHLWRNPYVADSATRNHVLKTIEHMTLGGLYDHLRGGFARYSVDDRWLVPHFEKMLYDTALIIPQLARAWYATGDETFRARIKQSLAWLDAEMKLPNGLYAASLDADSDGEEGAFYVWTLDEVRSVLGPHADRFARLYDITDRGNFEGKSIPNLLETGNLSDNDQHFADESISRLVQAQDKRNRPARDDKALTDWNALLVMAKVSAAHALENATLIAEAAELFEILYGDGPDTIPHSRLAEAQVHPAMATDHANLANAALHLHQATLDKDYLEKAEALLVHLDDYYADESKARFYLASKAQTDLILRTISATDDAVPNHNATIASAMARMATLTENADWKARAEAMLTAFSDAIVRNPLSHLGMLNARDELDNPVTLTVRSSSADLAWPFMDVARHAMEPNLLLLHENTGEPVSAIMCADQTCLAPVKTPRELAEAMATSPTGIGGSGVH
ncbi:thioredoxin domain-containing protein [Tepidamorphus sp. 3E244]|uniref:thioredoxin domain-containing protein n=1 Tax=Tepidamorphus sp. 3E244 TaxID=3385498 RepID=UPI0038FCD83B